MKKGCLVCERIKLFRAKYGMCANHALSGEIFYRKSRMTGSENYYPTLAKIQCILSLQIINQLNPFKKYFNIYFCKSLSFLNI